MIQKNLVRLLLTTQLSNRELGRRCNMSHNTVGRYRDIVVDAGLTVDVVTSMSELDLEARFKPSRKARKSFVEPDWSNVHQERNRPGVTLRLLYEEYADSVTSGRMSESEFRRRYTKLHPRAALVMRKERIPGEELLVDYSGRRPRITDPVSGMETPVEMWVGVLGASRRTFVYCTRTQTIPDWIDANERALRYYGATPKFLVPDNLKAAVSKITGSNGHYINPTYQAFADHYDMMVMPTRPRKPKDKGGVENGVRLAQMWILARLRDRVFFSIEELNVAIAELVEVMNNKPMRARGGASRNDLFESLDRPAMTVIRPQPYEFAEWKINVKVPQDYHVLVERNYYSVPHALVGRRLSIRVTVSCVEAYHGHALVATHDRCYGTDQFVTKDEHRPPAHRMFGEEGFADMLSWAETVGNSVRDYLVLHRAANKNIGATIQAFRGLKRLARDFGRERVTKACARAIKINATSVISVKSMLARGMEDAPVRGLSEHSDVPKPHTNVRGPSTYD